MVLFLTVVFLSKQNNEKKSEIIALNQKINKMEIELNNTKRDLDSIPKLKYKAEVLRKKYPSFSKITEVVFRKSQEHGVDPNLIMGLIEIESNFKRFAVSSAGAYGLMQINYKVWKNEFEINSERIFEIEYNINIGIQILKRYLKVAKGDIMRALHLYNNGYLYNNEAYKYKVISTVFSKI
ncbi:MAG: transglycosylase SLT domain-containing protein [Candidatus Aminicenantes bacterium]|nr:transglycosylase SLT domain-containing protein [Candidatus Aminicenantes bacterium]